MLVLPTIILTLSGVSGAGGLALLAKSMVDLLDASSTNRLVQEQNERNILRFHACSEKLNASLEDLGKQRMIITKDFSVFIHSFEKIHNRPRFSNGEDVSFPQFDFDEIKNVQIVADVLLGATLGSVSGAALAAAATSGTTVAVMAFGTASTGTKIAELSGAAATKAALAALGGGSLATGGGGIALGTLVLNIATLGVGILVEGIAMAYAGSLSKKYADSAKRQMLNNEAVIMDAINMQFSITRLAEMMKQASVDICNNVYKPLVLQFKELVNRKQDWNTYSEDEKLLVENNILAVQILHFLNNTPLYKVVKINERNEIEGVEANTREVATAIKQTKQKIEELRC